MTISTAGMRGRAAAALATAASVLLVVALAGCVQRPEPRSFVGSTLSEAKKALPSPTVIDLSEPIVQLPADYAEGDDGDDWIVVTACPSEGGAALGIIPSDAVTPRITRAAKAGDYDDLIGKCLDR